MSDDQNGQKELAPSDQQQPEKPKILLLDIGYNPKTKWFQLAWQENDTKKNVLEVPLPEDGTLPAGDGSVELIRAWEALHFMGEIYTTVMAEIARVLCPGGILSIQVPEFPCHDSITHPDIKRQFIPQSWQWAEQDLGLTVFHVEHRDILIPDRDRGIAGKTRRNLLVDIRKPDPAFDAMIEKRREELLSTDLTPEQRDGLRIM